MLGEIGQRLLAKLALSLPGGSTLRPWLHRQRGVKIGKGVWLSQQVYLDEVHPDAITIGDNSTIGYRSAVFTHFYWGPKRDIEHAGAVTIEKDVFIGPYCVILPNVHIGEGAVIKAGTVVTRNVPAFTFWGSDAGRPLARVTVPLNSKTEYHAFVRGLRPIRRATKHKEPPVDG